MFMKNSRHPPSTPLYRFVFAQEILPESRVSTEQSSVVYMKHVGGDSEEGLNDFFLRASCRGYSDSAMKLKGFEIDRWPVF
jgi:hypothetical protein